uniref:Uncharacterized protein n=1 Tax=Rhizophora mucronata TaxID=61149 RepID=A0A2P2N665_RHIMU
MKIIHLIAHVDSRMSVHPASCVTHKYDLSCEKKKKIIADKGSNLSLLFSITIIIIT